MIAPSDHWKSDFVIDPTRVYNGAIDSLDHPASEMLLSNQDNYMKEVPVESASSSSQVTLVAEDSVPRPSKTLDQLGGITNKCTVRSTFDEPNVSVQDI
jgi:hypothetical protein